jgi:hypothetical protein
MDLVIKPADMVRCVQEQRMRSIGQIVRTDKQRTVKVTKEWRPIAERRIGRQRFRWGDGVRGVVEKMTIQNWSKMAMDREATKRIVEQAGRHEVL